MKKNTFRKRVDSLDEAEKLSALDVPIALRTGESQLADLAQLVWKYFEEEIRETMIEVQEAIQTDQGSSIGQISHRKQK